MSELRQHDAITTDSDGRSLGESPEALAAFWAWFGDSKAVDDQGRPLVLYRLYDNLYSASIDAASQFDHWETRQTAPVYLRVQAPLSAVEDDEWARVAEVTRVRLDTLNPWDMLTEQTPARLAEHGYDGLRFADSIGDVDHESWLCVDEQQIHPIESMPSRVSKSAQVTSRGHAPSV